MEQHEQNRRPLDSLQIAAAVCVALLILGEVALLVWLFQSHRSPRMPVQSTEIVELYTLLSSNTAASNTISPLVTGLVTASTATVSEPLLNPSLKIQRAHRDGVLLQLQLRAQTGEREFHAAAAHVSVEWQLTDGSQRVEWLAVPVAWENFAVKTLAARYDGVVPVSRCTVRTFYRQQPQDTMTLEISTP
ncbi:MAG: hypothetical protein FJ395_00240 [Verrucomicrobia bacterium]|nr:hypothetical protein [Verrucomicrobiota bacterium]